MTDCCVARTGGQDENTISAALSDEDEQDDSILTENGNNDQDSDFEEAMSILTKMMPPGLNTHPVLVSAMSSIGGSYQNFSSTTSRSLSTRQQLGIKKDVRQMCSKIT